MATAGSSGTRLVHCDGTDLSFSIEGRTANVLTNVPDPGQLAPVPDIEVNVVPVTGSANEGDPKSSGLHGIVVDQ